MPIPFVPCRTDEDVEQAIKRDIARYYRGTAEVQIMRWHYDGNYTEGVAVVNHEHRFSRVMYFCYRWDAQSIIYLRLTEQPAR